MKTTFRYIEVGETFSHNDNLYIKSNHQRGKRSDIKTGGLSPIYRKFKKNDIVISKHLTTILNEYMEVK